MRIVFAGTPSFAVPALELSASRFEIAAVLTARGKPSGRGRQMVDTPVKSAALARGLQVLETDCPDQMLVSAVEKLGAQMLVVVAYGHIFKKPFLDLFPAGGVNLHPSLLPRWRGPSPIPAVVRAGDRATGITVQRLSLKMDAGDILLQETEELTGRETTEELEDRFSKRGAELLLRAVEEFAAGRLSPRPQDESKATYCRLIKKEDGRISWTLSAAEIDRMVRAYTPWPGAFTGYEGRKVFLRAGFVYQYEKNDKEPGRVLGVDKRHGILINTGEGIRRFRASARIQKNAGFHVISKRMRLVCPGRSWRIIMHISDIWDKVKRIRNIFPNASDAPEKRNFKNMMLLLVGIFLLLVVFVTVSFFIFIRGDQITYVPDVQNKNIVDALLLLQERHLTVQVEAAYSKSPADRDTVLRQNPDPGAKVKEGRTVMLLISRGTVISKVENYVGKSLNEVRELLKAEFSTFDTPPIQIKEPVIYQYDNSPVGTVIAQNPKEGTELGSQIISLVLVVSNGKGQSAKTMPTYIGMDFASAITDLSAQNIIFVFSSRVAKKDEAGGVVVSQKPEAGSKLTEGMVVSLEITNPTNVPEGKVFGIYTDEIPSYGVPVDILVEAVTSSSRQTLLQMKHPGGTLSLPYILPKGIEIVLTIAGKEIKRTEVYSEK